MTATAAADTSVGGGGGGGHSNKVIASCWLEIPVHEGTKVTTTSRCQGIDHYIAT